MKLWQPLTSWRRWILPATAGGVLLAVVWTSGQWHRIWSLLTGGGIEALAAYIRSFGVWGPLVSIALMVLQSVAAPIPAWLVTGANGAIFGMWWGAVISWLGAMAGATVTFSLARWGRRLALERLVATHGRRIDELSSTHGFAAVLVARLLPFVSFDLISYLAGASRIALPRFLLATGIGMIPGTLAYTLFGYDLSRARTTVWELSLLGVFAALVWLLHRWWRSRAAHVARGE